MIHGKKKSFCNSFLSTLQEKERLESLKSYFILDTLPDSNFDEIAYLAAKSFKCPFSMINFIAEDRVWSKSLVGEFLSPYEKSFSFCQYAIQADDLFVIPNTLNDERVALSPYVVNAPHIRFYAAVPLLSYDGYCIGTLAILDVKENSFTEDQFMYLKYLATRVMNFLELRRKKILLAKEMRVSKQHLPKPKLVRENIIKHQVNSMHDGLVFEKNMKYGLDIKQTRILKKEAINNECYSDNNLDTNSNSYSLLLQDNSEVNNKLTIKKKLFTKTNACDEEKILLSNIISCVQKIYRRKIKQLFVQLEFISHVQKSFIFDSNSQILSQLFVTLIDHALEEVTHKKYKWILFELKENDCELEICFSFSNCSFEFLMPIDPTSRAESLENSNKQAIFSKIEQFINLLNGHCFVDRTLVNSKLTIYIPKNNRSLLN